MIHLLMAVAGIYVVGLVAIFIITVVHYKMSWRSYEDIDPKEFWPECFAWSLSPSILWPLACLAWCESKF